MHVHFVCTANAYRSRLAEAYANSKSIPGLHVSSSGTQATANICGPICWQAQRLIEVYSLVPYTSPMWTQTSSSALSSVDEVVFMGPEVYEFAVAHHLLKPGGSYHIWHVPDLDELTSSDIQETDEQARITETTFALIRAHVDKLLVAQTSSAQAKTTV